MTTKKAQTFKLTSEAARMLEEMAEKMENKTHALEACIRLEKAHFLLGFAEFG